MADGGVGEAQEKAQEVAGEAQEKARESVRQQVEQRSSEAGERVTGTAQDFRSVGEELRKQGKDTPAKLADRAAEEAERLGSYLKEKGPDEMLHDVEDLGRQRPWAVLAGGLALGVVAARFLKASSRNRYQQRSGGARTNGQVPQRLAPPPVSRSAVEPVATPPPPAATPNPTAMPATPSPSASPAA